MNQSKTELEIPSMEMVQSRQETEDQDESSKIKISKTDLRKPSITESNSDTKRKETWSGKLVELSEDQQWERVNVILIPIAIMLILNASLLLYYVLYHFMLSSPKTILVNRTIPRQEIVGKITLLFGLTILVCRVASGASQN